MGGEWVIILKGVYLIKKLAYDNTCKYLAETYATNFVRWIWGINPTNIRVLKTEILPEPIVSDSLTMLEIDNAILQIEFQTVPYSNPSIPYRMLNYWTQLYGKYWCDVNQVVIYLKETGSELVLEDKFEVQNTRHSYRVIRLWEQDPEPFLNEPALLPLATLTRSDEPPALLEQVARRVDIIEEPAQQQNISAAAEILAGLRFDRTLIRQLFREELMQESVIYQDILQKGEIRGEIRGEVRGEQRGLERGKREGEATLIIIMLTCRFGTLPANISEKIRALSTPQIEELARVQLDFSTVEDVENWLDRQS